MNKVNLGDPYTHRITLRLTDKQFEFLTKVSTMMGCTPSDYLRMSVNSTMVATSKSLEKIMKGEVGMSNENVETDINDII